MEWLNAEWVSKVMGVVMLVNVLLVAVSKALDIVKDSFHSEGAGKAAGIIVKIADGIQKVLDAIGYNPKHIEKK